MNSSARKNGRVFTGQVIRGLGAFDTCTYGYNHVHACRVCAVDDRLAIIIESVKVEVSMAIDHAYICDRGWGILNGFQSFSLIAPVRIGPHLNFGGIGYTITICIGWPVKTHFASLVLMHKAKRR